MPRKPAVGIRVYVVDYKRPHWVLRWKDPVTRRWRTETSGTANYDEAVRAAGNKEAELAVESGPVGEITWFRFRERYQSEYLSTLAATTQKKAHTALKLVTDELRPDRLRDVTTDALSALFGRMRKTKAREEATYAGYARQISAALGWAVDMGMLHKRPRMPRQQRYRTERAKGRAVTDDEFQKILDAIPEVVTPERVASWEHYLRGLWWSGLRLEESIEELHWTREDKMRVELGGKHPLLIIRAEGEKGYQDREYPVAPEFGMFLRATPESDRVGYVFNPVPQAVRGTRPSCLTVSRTVIKICQKAGVMATPHDLRRSFGFRWSSRVMPAVLKELMRHSSIQTTMKYYVTRNAQATGDVIWGAVENLDLGSILGNTSEKT